MTKNKKFSGKKISKAGRRFANFNELVENESELDDVLEVISYWRTVHNEPLDVAVNYLQNNSSLFDKSVLFAKRLKRFASIFSKLKINPQSSLRTMHDIGGCRAIFQNEKKLRKALREMKKDSRFRDSNGELRYWDYIKTPKDSGYRSYHLVGLFADNIGDMYRIELQLRTRIQHYWATALEIVDLFTGQALKSSKGDKLWSEFFFEVSYQFSKIENIHLFNTLSEDEKIKRYVKILQKSPECVQSCKNAQRISKILNVRPVFDGFAQSIKIIGQHMSEFENPGYTLLTIDIEKHTTSTRFFDADEPFAIAEKEYIEKEKEAAQSSSLVVALVSSTHFTNLRDAYPNYFADSEAFMKLLDLVNRIDFR